MCILVENIWLKIQFYCTDCFITLQTKRHLCHIKHDTMTSQLHCIAISWKLHQAVHGISHPWESDRILMHGMLLIPVHDSFWRVAWNLEHFNQGFFGQIWVTDKSRLTAQCWPGHLPGKYITFRLTTPALHQIPNHMEFCLSIYVHEFISKSLQTNSMYTWRMLQGKLLSLIYFWFF